jgi:hypothetical protein
MKIEKHQWAALAANGATASRGFGWSSIEEAFEKIKDIIITWFSVMTRGPNAFEKIDLESSATLVYSLKFMFFMAVVSLIINLPLAARIGGSFLTATAVPGALVVEAVIEYLTVGLILYGSMKLVGGKGKLQSCIAVYCFLTAYMPIISFLMLPSRMVTIPALLQGSNYIQAVTAVQLETLSIWNLASILLSFLLVTVVFVLFFKAIFQHFRALHQLSRTRALVAFIGGLFVSAVAMAVFLEPSLSLIYQKLAPP